MKYRNTTDGTLRFRATNVKGVKQIFELKPEEEMESDKEVNYVGLKMVGKGILKKTKKKGDD